MDWFKIVTAGLLLVAGFAFPVLLVRAVRRKDGRRVFDMLVAALALVVVGIDDFRPGGLDGLSPPLHGLARAALVLFFVNLLGLSRRLFRPRAKPEPQNGH